MLNFAANIEFTTYDKGVIEKLAGLVRDGLITDVGITRHMIEHHDTGKIDISVTAHRIEEVKLILAILSGENQ